MSQEFRVRNVLLEALHCISEQTVSVNTKSYAYIMNDDELADLMHKNLKDPIKGTLLLMMTFGVRMFGIGIIPNSNNGSRILLTTRESEVVMYAYTSIHGEINLVNLGNSWKLLCDKVFGPEHGHPPELEEIGK
ncbi:putative late blight resistance protein homolog R1B-8 [Solanum pennellii]|uniref:Late blight resistance protein homolog R1B-8 n=1 Tax=Solanum pennellii TaxID=28526 RepID=A0ABM1G1N2_SOLPN|nr:putative late blight resistance protein homolog R1B-8 [Solanum pennellii]